ncbi:MAG: CDP-glycerol glycerophosphotransferase family protein [Promethearchaeota archaeon]
MADIDTVILIYSDFLTNLPGSYFDKGNKIVSCSIETSSFLKKQNIMFFTLKDYFQEKLNFSYITQTWIETWAFLSKGNTYPFLDIFKSENINFWWFIDIELFYRLQNHLRSISELVRIIEYDSPKKIILLDSDNERIKLFKQICLIKKVQLVVKTNNLKLMSEDLLQSLKNVILVFWRLLRMRNIRKWSMKYQKTLDQYNIRYFNNTFKKGIFLTHPMHWRPSNDPSKYGKKENYYFNQLFEQFSNYQIQPIELQVVRRKKPNIQVIKEMVSTEYGIPIKLLPSYSTKRTYDSKTVIKIIENRLIVQFQDTQFLQSLNFRGIPLHKYVLFYVLELLKSNVPVVLETIEQIKEMISIEEPSFIFLINEYSLYERATLIAGKMMNTPSFAMQHGLITADSRGYAIKSDIAKGLHFKLPPRPNKTLVYGEYFAKLLINYGDYTPDQIFIVGNPTWDNLHQYKSHYDLKSIRMKLKIPEQQKVILHATENLPGGLNIGVTNLIINTFLNITDGRYFLLIKVHPGEKIESYKHLLPDDRNDILIIKDVALGEVLSISDVLIAAYSTTVFDAVISNVPAITLAISYELMNTFFYDLNVSFKADETNLGHVLKNLLDEKMDNSFQKMRVQITEEFAAGLDMKSIDRIITVLRNESK